MKRWLLMAAAASDDATPTRLAADLETELIAEYGKPQRRPHALRTAWRSAPPIVPPRRASYWRRPNTPA